MIPLENEGRVKKIFFNRAHSSGSESVAKGVPAIIHISLVSRNLAVARLLSRIIVLTFDFVSEGAAGIVARVGEVCNYRKTREFALVEISASARCIVA